MLKTFRRDLAARKANVTRPQLYWALAISGLVALNAVALFLCIKPPAGTRHDLLQEQLAIHRQIGLSRAQLLRLRTVSGNVRTGSRQVLQFGTRYVLPERRAYSQVMEEIAHIAKVAGIQERDAVFTEEPIEGTSDLFVLNMTANYQGTYDSFMRFLYQVDTSPMLLVLDNLQASPQEKPGQINTSIRFQDIVREDTTPGVAEP